MLDGTASAATQAQELRRGARRWFRRC